MAELLYAVEHGAALTTGRPLIVPPPNGLASHYKPPGRHFYTCADGLLLTPFPYQRQRQSVTRE